MLPRTDNIHFGMRYNQRIRFDEWHNLRKRHNLWLERERGGERELPRRRYQIEAFFFHRSLVQCAEIVILAWARVCVSEWLWTHSPLNLMSWFARCEAINDANSSPLSNDYTQVFNMASSVNDHIRDYFNAAAAIVFHVGTFARNICSFGDENALAEGQRCSIWKCDFHSVFLHAFKFHLKTRQKCFAVCAENALD